jgi:polyisoprenoid-binding protein YceI
MKFIKAITLFAVISMSICANAQTSQQTAEWLIDSANSRVNFISIKKGNIGESHSLTDLSGSITDGKVSIILKPDSVESMVPIRNDRMREFLFETGLYPSIEVSADVVALLKDLKNGASLLATLPASLSMHGVSKELQIDVRINKLSTEMLIVASTQPVIIRAADYNMIDGIRKLSALVNNLPIAESVPVSFSLQFNRVQ